MLSVIAVVAGTGAYSQNDILWKTVGDWDVLVAPELSNGCYALGSWSTGTILHIGLDPSDDTFYFLLGNKDWASLTPDQEYDIQIKFGARPAWDVTTRGVKFDTSDMVFLHAKSDKFEFTREFQSETKMSIVYNSRPVEVLKLTGSLKAFQAVKSCQNEVNAYGLSAAIASGNAPSPRPYDPFAE